jgi:CheY-like chemotaxis protein
MTADPVSMKAVKELPPILIAEDDDDDFFFFRRTVRASAIDNPILRFRDGAEFVKFAAESTARPRGEPWLFFVDISMPFMNGFDVLAWLHERPEQFNVRPIMLSGSNREEDISKARGLGAHDYLVKPLSVGALARVAASCLKSVPA